MKAQSKVLDTLVGGGEGGLIALDIYARPVRLLSEVALGEDGAHGARLAGQRRGGGGGGGEGPCALEKGIVRIHRFLFDHDKC